MKNQFSQLILFLIFFTASHSTTAGLWNSLFGYGSVDECRKNEVKECRSEKCEEYAVHQCNIDFYGRCKACMLRVLPNAIDVASIPIRTTKSPGTRLGETMLLLCEQACKTEE